MPSSTLVPARPCGLDPTGLRTAPVAGYRGRPAPAVSLVVAGLVTMALAAAVVARAGNRPAHGSVAAATPAPSSAVSTALTISGPSDVSVVSQVYGPGEASGWHAHPGIHAVAILSGTLTVYDERCQAQRFDAGSSYVGGQELHLARNDTKAPVEMVVTYLSPVTAADSHLRRGTPSCALPALGE